MKDIKAYIRVPIEQKLPAKISDKFIYSKDCYVTNVHGSVFTARYNHKYFYWVGTNNQNILNVSHWLKEISLTEYMVGLAEWIRTRHGLEIIEHEKQPVYVWKNEIYSSEKLVTIYLNEKGIIWK